MLKSDKYYFKVFRVLSNIYNQIVNKNILTLFLRGKYFYNPLLIYNVFFHKVIWKFNYIIFCR